MPTVSTNLSTSAPLSSSSQLKLWLGVLLCLAIGIIYALIIDRDIVGFTRDDGVYAVSAKALAQGQGFKLLHLITEPAQVKYPIVYPLILSLGWLINPVFPDNLPLLTWLTVACATGGLIAVFYYLFRIKQVPWLLACGIILLTAANFYFIYFSTSIMAEAPYLLFSFLTLILAERWIRQQSNTHTTVNMIFWGMVATSVLTFHTRQIGLSLILAITAWLWIRRFRKQATIYLGFCLVLTLLPWMIWTGNQFHPTWHTLPLDMGYGPYTYELSNLIESTHYLDRIHNTLGSTLYRLLEGMFNLIPNLDKIIALFDRAIAHNFSAAAAFLLGVTFCSYLLFGYFVMMLVSFARQAWQQRSLQEVSLAALYVLSYLSVSLVWSYDEQMARFLPMILPIIWWYFFRPLVRQIQTGQYPRFALTAIAFFMLLSLAPGWKTFYNINLVRQEHWIDMEGKPLWREYQSAFAYIRKNLPTDAVLGCTSDPVFYLYTGRKTFYLNSFALPVMVKRSGNSLKAMDELFAMLDHHRVNYLIVEPHMLQRSISALENPMAKAMLLDQPQRFRLRYISPLQALKIYEILPP